MSGADMSGVAMSRADNGKSVDKPETKSQDILNRLDSILVRAAENCKTAEGLTTKILEPQPTIAGREKCDEAEPEGFVNIVIDKLVSLDGILIETSQHLRKLNDEF